MLQCQEVKAAPFFQYVQGLPCRDRERNEKKKLDDIKAQWQWPTEDIGIIYSVPSKEMK